MIAVRVIATCYMYVDEHVSLLLECSAFSGRCRPPMTPVFSIISSFLYMIIVHVSLRVFSVDSQFDEMQRQLVCITLISLLTQSIVYCTPKSRQVPLTSSSELSRDRVTSLLQVLRSPPSAGVLPTSGNFRGSRQRQQRPAQQMVLGRRLEPARRQCTDVTASPACWSKSPEILQIIRKLYSLTEIIMVSLIIVPHCKMSLLCSFNKI